MPVMSLVERTFCRSLPWCAFAERVVLPWALSGDDLHGDVLEIGGGTGAMAAGVIGRFPDLRLIVTDIDPVMVAAARRRLASLAQVSVEQADVTALPFADATFDVVTSYLMLHHVVDWRPALTEALRVLRPGGRLVGYDLTDSLAARLVHRVDGSPVSMIGSVELRVALRDAGFTGVAVASTAIGHVMRFEATRP